MGTNYYLRYNICPYCGSHNTLHIGKSSIGWQFTFQYINESIDPKGFCPKELLMGSNYFNLEIDSFEKWQKVIQKYVVEYETAKIFDENDKEVSPKELFKLIESKVLEPNNHCDYVEEYECSKNNLSFKDDEGHPFIKTDFS